MDEDIAFGMLLEGRISTAEYLATTGRRLDNIARILSRAELRPLLLGLAEIARIESQGEGPPTAA